MGIYYIAAYLRNNGFEVMITDAEAENLKTDDILKQLHDFDPGYIGISSTTVAFHRALEVANSIRKEFKDKKIILKKVATEDVPDIIDQLIARDEN